jgi:hypothetical protein
MIEVTIVQGGRKEPALPGGRRSRPQPLELIDAERAGLGRRREIDGFRRRLRRNCGVDRGHGSSRNYCVFTVRLNPQRVYGVNRTSSHYAGTPLRRYWRPRRTCAG